jgi:hypothetical protein
VVPGAEKFLEGNGGLRAQILSDGVIALGDARLVLSEPVLNIGELRRPIGGTGAVPSP